MSVSDHAKISAALVWYAVLGFFILTGLAGTAMWLKPTWLGFERQAFTQSHQYIESKQTQLMTLVDKANELETEIAKYQSMEGDYGKIIQGLQNQQSSLTSRIKQESQRIPQNELPQSVQNYLRQN